MDELLSTKIKGAFVGAAYGEALGYIKESATVDRYGNKINKLSNLIDWNNSKKLITVKYAGTYSYNTQLLLASSRCYSKSYFNVVRFFHELKDFSYYHESGEMAVLRACEKDFEDIDKDSWYNNFFQGYYTADENGALVRLIPHVIANLKDNNYENAYNNCIKDVLSTHGHPCAIFAQLFGLKFFWDLFNMVEPFTAFINAYDSIKNFTLESVKIIPKAWFDTWKEDARYDFYDSEARAKRQFNNKMDLIKKSLSEYIKEELFFKKMDAIGPSGDDAINSILVPIFIVLNNKGLSFKDTLLIPANMEDADNDTVTCLTGAIKGFLVGLNRFEDEDILKVQDKEYLEKTAIELYNNTLSINYSKNYHDFDYLSDLLSNGYFDEGDVVDTNSIFGNITVKHIMREDSSTRYDLILSDNGQTITLIV